jgi:ArsR family transcriptional regulator, lead/cadmium/zinc/bismuth-responsive transcriptional repressor
MQTKHLAKVFKALSDDTRIIIVRHVAKEKEIACQELLKRFPLSQPTMSHHFNKLVNAGILNNRRDGVLWFYTLNTDYLTKLGIDIEKLVLTNTKRGGAN